MREGNTLLGLRAQVRAQGSAESDLRTGVAAHSKVSSDDGLRHVVVRTRLIAPLPPPPPEGNLPLRRGLSGEAPLGVRIGVKVNSRTRKGCFPEGVEGTEAPTRRPWAHHVRLGCPVDTHHP